MKEIQLQGLIQKSHPSPGFHYIHFDRNNVIYRNFSGTSNIKTNDKITERTSFHAFSTTKVFTAVAIMKLHEVGIINISDPISKFLPELPFHTKLTIEDFLCHQSSLPNPLPLNWTHFIPEQKDFSFYEFAINLLKSTKIKSNPASKSYSYSNLNYLALGLVIIKATNQNYEDAINELIIRYISEDYFIGFDYGKTHSQGHHKSNFLQNFVLSIILKDKAIKLDNSHKDWMLFKPFVVSGLSYGGLMAEPNALMSFCRLLFYNNPLLLSDKTKKQMFTEKLNNHNKPTGMSLGFFTGHLNNQSYLCHAGGGGGYYSEIRIYPDLNRGSVIMLNSSGFRDKRILDKLDKILIND